MRILKTFFLGLLWSVIGAIILFFVMREVLLYMAVSQFRSVTKKVYSTQTPADFTRTCLEYGGVPVDGQTVTQMQVRFTSDKKFVLEIVCNGAESLRQVLVDYSLPLLVRKDSGQSGLIRGLDGTAVVLSVFNRKGVVYQENGFVFSSTNLNNIDELDLNSGPVTTCSGYGYECCDQLFQIGEGAQQPAATDCPKSCFPQCLSRPVILIFKGVPLDPAGLRKVNIRSGEEVTFYYSITNTGGDIFAEEDLFNEAKTELVEAPSFEERILVILDKYARRSESEKQDNTVSEIILDFGDGVQETVSDLQGELTHTYTCSKSDCQYTAKLLVKTTSGIENLKNELSIMRVNVGGKL